MAGMCRHTGRLIGGWEHTVQSLEIIFTTRFHERVMRRWFGSILPHVLGQSIIPSTLTRVFSGLIQSITVKEFNAFLRRYDAREPRFVVQNVVAVNNSAETIRQGKLALKIEGIYRPRAHLGDLSVESRKSFFLYGENGKVNKLSTDDMNE